MPLLRPTGRPTELDLAEPERVAEVMDAAPEILNHNVETVARRSNRVRAKAKYPRSDWKPF